MLDFFHEIRQTLGHNKLRTFLTGIAVTWGIFMLIVLLSMARGVTNSFQKEVSSGEMARINIWRGSTSIPYKGNREGRNISFKEQDLRIIPERVPKYAETTTSRIYINGKITTPKGEAGDGYTGIFPSEKEGVNMSSLKGRFITDRDMKEKAKVMVIHNTYAEKLFPPDGKDALGNRVNCNGLSFVIVGVYESRWNRNAYVPFTTSRVYTSDSEDIGNITVNLRNVETEADADDAEKEIRNTLASAHNFDPKDENAVYIGNYFKNAVTMGKALSILDISVWVLGILTLLSGIVGISNIMFVTVRERTHEIGIRRAIGARPRQIISQVIAESVAITVTFGYIGIVLGMVGSQIIAAIVGDDGPLLNPTVSLSIAFEVTAVLVAAGMLAGLFPALKALKVKPVEALRDE